MSLDTSWDVTDRRLGRVEHTGGLQPGQSYDAVLDAELPAVTPGQYRVIVRTDIFNQVYEDLDEQNNATTSLDPIAVTVDEILLGVPLSTTLDTGQTRLFQVNVPADQTLRIRLRADHENAANELFVRYGAAPTTVMYDAAYRGSLSPSQTALVPNTKPGWYYILLHGHSEPANDTPVDLVAELLPLSIDAVHTDTAGDAVLLAALQEGGMLRPDGTVPPLREHPAIVSLMATLASGVLIGPAGSDLRSTGSLLDLFDQIRTWYGHDADQLAEVAGVNPNANPIAALPDFSDYDPGMAQQTYFDVFEVYVPWIPFEDRGNGLPADFQISGVEPEAGEQFANLDLSSYLDDDASASGLAALLGPFTGETGGYLPAGAELPYSVQFQNDPQSAAYVNEVRVVTALDPDLDAHSFRLGDIQIGRIGVHIPSDRGLFQGDFDFVASLGFTLRVSAGIDLSRGEATWLLQAIDPVTGELLRDRTRGLLTPNNALGEGAGFVSYTVMPIDDIETGTEITALARVLFDTAAPEDTATLSQIVDGTAPATVLDVSRLSDQTDNYRVTWTATDDPLGGMATQQYVITIDGGNHAPVITPPPPVNVQEGDSLTVPLTVDDPDGDTLFFWAEDLPPGASLDHSDGMLAWTPDYVSAGIYDVRMYVSDGVNVAGTGLHLMVSPQDRAPTLTPIPDKTLMEGDLLRFYLDANDPDDDALLFASVDLPDGAMLNPITGLVEWYVGFNQHGLYTPGFEVHAGGAGDTQDAQLTVTNINAEPVFDPVDVPRIAEGNGDGNGPADVLDATTTFIVSVHSANEPPLLDFVGSAVAVTDQLAELTFRATDPDNEVLTFSVNGLPSSAVFSPGGEPGSAVLQWTPTAAEEGVYHATLTVTDTGNGDAQRSESDSAVFDVVARATNDAPILAPISNQTTAEGDELLVALMATDNDGDKLSYFAANLPSGAILDPESGELSWTPNFDQAGTYNDIHVSVTDGHDTSSQSISITVTDSNRAPHVIPLPTQFSREGATLVFDVVATDPDGDPLTYALFDPPEDTAHVDPATGHFQWSVGYDEATPHLLTFAVTDAHGATVESSVVVLIDNVNRAPVVATSNHAVRLGDTLQFTITASDPDAGTTLQYAARNLPDGAAVDNQTGVVQWLAGPGQAGEYAVTLDVSDGLLTTSQIVLVRAEIEPSAPTVIIEQTPSFPVSPGASPANT